MTSNQKLLSPHTKICKIYGVVVKLKIKDFLKKNSKGLKPSTNLDQKVDEKLTINSNLFVIPDCLDSTQYYLCYSQNFFSKII